MRSKASLGQVPLHPALVHFPIAFLLGAFGFDIAGRLTNNPVCWTIAGWLGLLGVGTALLAAIPGFVDYFLTVPPKSSGKRRATQHMILNLSAVILFAAAWLLRRPLGSDPTTLVLALEAAGSVALVTAAYLGGVLVSRNQVAVDHRYAAAGRWSEQRVNARGAEPVVVAQVTDLLVDQMKLLHVGGRRIVLARSEDGYSAFDDHCTHRGGPLSDGVLISGTVQCPWHGSQFDVRTGAVCGGPATLPIRSYRVEQSGSDILLYPEAEPVRAPRLRSRTAGVKRA